MAKLFLIFAMSVVLAFNCQGQRNAVWVFGDSAGLDFGASGSDPVGFISGSGWHQVIHGSICDTAGNLELYTTYTPQFSPNGFKLEIRNFQGDILLDSIPCWINGNNNFLILPKSDGSRIYYIFTIGWEIDANSGGACSPYVCPSLQYHVIDMNLNQGNGGVVESHQNLIDSLTLTAKICAIKKADGKGWWIVAHQDLSDKFIVVPFDQGIFSPPIFQSIGPFSNVPTINYDAVGEICVSASGDKIVMVQSGGDICLFDFDRCAGTLSGYIELGDTNTFYYGASFSPNGKVLYVSNLVGFGADSSRLFQFDLQAPNILNSETFIATVETDSMEFGLHELGPDGRIYIANGSQFINGVPPGPQYISFSDNLDINRIENPDVVGLGCNFVKNAISLNGGVSGIGLPSFPNYNLGTSLNGVAEAGADTVVTCAGVGVLLGDATASYDSCTVVWTDDATGGVIGNGGVVVVSPLVTTLYRMVVVDTMAPAGCNETEDSVVVRVLLGNELPVADAGMDTSICAGDSVDLLLSVPIGNANLIYEWRDGDGNLLYQGGPLAVPLRVGPGDTTVYITSVYYAGKSCTRDEDTVVVNVLPVGELPVADGGGDVLGCAGDSVLLGSSVGNPLWVYEWRDGDGVVVGVGSQLGVIQQGGAGSEFYSLTVGHLSGLGCAVAVDSVAVGVDGGVGCEDGVFIYPNPFGGDIHIRIRTEGVHDVQLRVVSSIGQELWAGDYLVDGGRVIDLDMGGFAAGVYVLVLEMGESVEVFRIVKD
jgi:hypothetical protein